jgi:uncharacterized protein (TIGR03000 family)
MVTIGFFMPLTSQRTGQDRKIQLQSACQSDLAKSRFLGSGQRTRLPGRHGLCASGGRKPGFLPKAGFFSLLSWTSANDYRTVPHWHLVCAYANDPDAGSEAWVTVRVPAANAEVFINGDKTDQTGTTREFISPALDKADKYQITARWMQNGQQVERKKEVRVEPGRRSMVDFVADAREEAIAPDDVNRAKPKETLKPPDRQPKPRDNKAPDQDN